MWSTSSISPIRLRRRRSSTTEAHSQIPESVRSLHIFNPDTDFALAAKSAFYTPPAPVAALRRRLALLPATYAGCGDAILLTDKYSDDEIECLDYRSLAREKGLELIPLPCRGREYKGDASELRAEPWGWNPSIRALLARRFDGIQLPSEEFIENVRRLSHRRITISFLSHPRIREISEIRLPREFTDTDEAIRFYESDGDVFFKAPWSSSGRGIVRTLDLEERHIRPWVGSFMASQGSVLGETAYQKTLDFATEWQCTDGRAEFLGFSLFEASARGKYHSNYHGDQKEIRDTIETHLNENLDRIVEAQRDALSELIAPTYSGPLGIDCMALRDGGVHPCVEINLRHTMGMAMLSHKS